MIMIFFFIIIADIKHIDYLVGFDNLTRLQLDNNNISKINNLAHLVTLTELGKNMGLQFFNDKLIFQTNKRFICIARCIETKLILSIDVEFENGQRGSLD